MSKITNISGFPEWLPHEKRIEEELTSRVRHIYESFGFIAIETPAVELSETLLSKGVADKELFFLQRAKASETEEASLGLHFDLTVPFARYVAQHFDKLTFPFRRYQFQKVWRGERPQKGRFREFYQFDIDIVAIDELPLACDAEILSAMSRAVGSLQIAPHEVRFNSRKILVGIYRHLGFDEVQQDSATTIVDKLEKIGHDGVLKELKQLGVKQDAAEELLQYCSNRFSASEITDKLSHFRIKEPLFKEGYSDLERVVELVSDDCRKHLVFDLSLARGLDYYTGIIFEMVLPQYRDFGAVASGGRYDNLTSQFIHKKLPGVGGSIGVTRLMDLVLRNDLMHVDAASGVNVLIAVYSEDQRARCNRAADLLRERGIACEVYFKSPKLGKQIEYGSAKGIRQVLFLDEHGESLNVKDLVTKEQATFSSLHEWIDSYSRSTQ